VPSLTRGKDLAAASFPHVGARFPGRRRTRDRRRPWPPRCGCACRAFARRIGQPLRCQGPGAGWRRGGASPYDSLRWAIRARRAVASAPRPRPPLRYNYSSRLRPGFRWTDRSRATSRSSRKPGRLIPPHLAPVASVNPIRRSGESTVSHSVLASRDRLAARSRPSGQGIRRFLVSRSPTQVLGSSWFTFLPSLF
jgi:hypothetical protein